MFKTTIKPIVVTLLFFSFNVMAQTKKDSNQVIENPTEEQLKSLSGNWEVFENRPGYGKLNFKGSTVDKFKFDLRKRKLLLDFSQFTKSYDPPKDINDATPVELDLDQLIDDGLLKSIYEEEETFTAKSDYKAKIWYLRLQLENEDDIFVFIFRPYFRKRPRSKKVEILAIKVFGFATSKIRTAQGIRTGSRGKKTDIINAVYGPLQTDSKGRRFDDK